LLEKNDMTVQLKWTIETGPSEMVTTAIDRFEERMGRNRCVGEKTYSLLEFRLRRDKVSLLSLKSALQTKYASDNKYTCLASSPPVLVSRSRRVLPTGQIDVLDCNIAQKKRAGVNETKRRFAVTGICR
jgi:hypothetical protein